MADHPRIEDLKRRVQKDPASIAFAELAEEYRRVNQHEDAVRVCRDGLDQHPYHVPARVTLGRALVSLDRCDEAQVEIEAVLRAAPDNFFALRTLAQIQRLRTERLVKEVEPAADVLARRSPAEGGDARLHDYDEGRDCHAARNDRWGDDERNDHYENQDARRGTPSGGPIDPAALSSATADSALQDLQRWLDAIMSDRARRSHGTV